MRGIEFSLKNVNQQEISDEIIEKNIVWLTVMSKGQTANVRKKLGWNCHIHTLMITHTHAHMHINWGGSKLINRILMKDSWME